MPKALNLDLPELEDLEWTDPNGHVWRIAGGVDLRPLLEVCARGIKAVESKTSILPADLLLELMDATAALFRSRHTDEELAGLVIPLAHVMPLVAGILNAMAVDMQLALRHINQEAATQLLGDHKRRRR